MPRILNTANSILTLATFAQEKGFIDGAKGLIPMNPTKLPIFGVMTDLLENQNISAEYLQWVQNMESSLEYISNSHDETYRSARLAKLGFNSFMKKKPKFFYRLVYSIYQSIEKIFSPLH